MKYIMFAVGTSKTRVPMIFGDVLNHAAVEKVCSEMLANHFGPVEVVSAGFTSMLTVEGVIGESYSLDKKSDVADVDIINKYDRFGGIVPEVK